MSQATSAITGLVRRLALVVGRGKVSQSDDTGVIQLLQILLGPKETSLLRRLGEFGLASLPPDQADAIALFVGGDRSNGVVIATHDLKSRFKLGNKGETALHDANGADGVAGKWIWLKKGAGIEVQANNEPVVINGAKSVTVNAGADGVTINTTGNVTFNMNGKNITINNPGNIVLGPGGKALVRDGDNVSGGVVHASQTTLTA